jgi:hypothetical protein
MKLPSAKELMKFVDGIIEEENNTRPYKHWEEVDVKTAMFHAIIQASQYFKDESDYFLEGEE